MPNALVIVESPAKARTISKFLGDGYVVESSVGHVRDLPANAAEVPAAYKDESWANLGVDVENDFKPLYVVSKAKKDQVKLLRQKLKDVDELYLATDEDREGEAIAWHLLEVLNPKVPVRRMVFHEITEHAIEEAIENPRDLDRRLVDAQEARRILDRLYGYEVSPVLWKKVKPGLSAGRVQSVATRVIVERERDRMRFVSASYWDLAGTFEVSEGQGERTFEAGLVSLDGDRLATGKDFAEDGTLTSDDVVLLAEQDAAGLVDDLQGADVTVRSVEAKPYRRKPHAPFTTSTLQQEAGRKLRFSSNRTMQVAQRLYENGYITYMRTDSTTLSGAALNAAREQILEKYGKDYLPDSPRIYTKKSKNAQEAHEAIRPAGDAFRTPDEVKSELNRDEQRLYELIWMRTVASQMQDAVGESVSVRLGATTMSGRDAEFSASGRTITFPGFLRAYVEGSDDPDADLEDREKFLPQMDEGDALDVVDLEAKGHETQPPSRYTEASLVKQLEELGVGRPSTYASIITTIIDRGYVWKKGSALVPSFTAFAVVTLLERHFPDLVDYAFTARMEDDLDNIANGETETVPWLRSFYFGDGEPGLHDKVSERLDEIDARDINSIPMGTDSEGREIVARVGRYGPYLQRSDDTASIPDDIPPDELTIEKATELLDAPSEDRELGEDPDTGEPVIARNGRYGPYVQLGPLDEKPKKTSSLFKSMELATIDLDTALKLLSLPRTVGQHPEDGEDVLALNGRYGPYLKWGKETRSLESEEQLFEISLDEAIKILAQPKQRGRRSQKILKELGTDPVSEKPMVVKDGRYGPYVTDGETNASLPKGLDPEKIDDGKASELLQARREKGPAKKKRRKKKT